MIHERVPKHGLFVYVLAIADRANLDNALDVIQRTLDGR
jgi:hypothetical protein